MLPDRASDLALPRNSGGRRSSVVDRVVRVRFIPERLKVDALLADMLAAQDFAAECTLLVQLLEMTHL